LVLSLGKFSISDSSLFLVFKFNTNLTRLKNEEQKGRTNGNKFYFKYLCTYKIETGNKII